MCVRGCLHACMWMFACVHMHVFMQRMNRAIKFLEHVCVRVCVCVCLCVHANDCFTARYEA